jgi:pimeloyl-ACP methyl ester carboxylesterase
MGEGPLILLLHGFPDTARTFDSLMPRIAALGYRVVAVFQRGYFPSDVPIDGDYSFRTRGRDVLAVIQALGVERAVVIGHDWGASAGYAAAILAPDRIEALIAVALPHQRAIRPLSPRQIWRARHVLFFQSPGSVAKTRRHDFAYLDRLYSRGSPGWSGPAHAAEIKRDFARPGRLEAAISYYRAYLRDYLHCSARQLTRSPIHVPTLLVVGSNDRAVAPAAYARQCAGITASCQVRPIAGAGHFPHLEEPDEFIEELREYLDPPQDTTALPLPIESRWDR